jgi:hypothetical protein
MIRIGVFEKGWTGRLRCTISAMKIPDDYTVLHVSLSGKLADPYLAVGKYYPLD